MALSQAMRDVIPLLEVLNRIQKAADVDIEKPVVRCTVSKIIKELWNSLLRIQDASAHTPYHRQ
jgi:hypothetical protein